MTAALAVISAALALGPLPPRGFALASKTSVPRTGQPRLILPTPRFAQYLMWGG
jgi:hypothetical protein